jgi:O-antigen/teichoic acid export membrane protein
MNANLSTIGSIAAALFGIGLVVVSVLPVVLNMLQGRQSKLQLTFTVRHLRWYFYSVTSATLIFAISTTAVLVGVVSNWGFTYPISFATCLAGIILISAACVGVCLEMAPALKA